MRQWWRSLLAVTGWGAVALALVSCAQPRQGRSHPSVEVVSTFFPITLFARAVAGDCARVTPLIPAQVSPHDFQARPADLALLRRAQVLVENGLGMETFLDKLVASAGNPRLLRVQTGAAVVPLRSEPGGEIHVDDSHGHDHGGVNPHIWLDPQRAIRQVESIRDALIQVDPRCAAGYRSRAGNYIRELRELDHDLAVQLAPYRGQSFVAFHDIAPYFAQRYGLKVSFLVNVPETNPSPADLVRVSDVVKRSQLKALMSEPQQGERSFNNLARDLGLRLSLFDPLETGTQKASQDPSTYLQVMRSNGRNLVRALTP